MTEFENCVVLKPWGREFQVFDNGLCSVWMLCINPGQGTSVHCHFSKTARFVPLAGTAVVRTNTDIWRLTFPQSVAVDRYEFHAVGNGGADDLWLIEIERPSGKNDLFRLRDSYGRSQGYESGDSIVRDELGRFGHFTLSSGFSVDGFHTQNGKIGCRLAVSEDQLMMQVGNKFYSISGVDSISEAA